MSEENVELVRRIRERWGREESIRDPVADDLDGKAVRFQWFQSHAEALEAAGVPDAST